MSAAWRLLATLASLVIAALAWRLAQWTLAGTDGEDFSPLAEGLAILVALSLAERAYRWAASESH